MNPDPTAKPIPRPLLGLVVLALAALLASWLIAENARSRLAQNTLQFDSSEQLRLQGMAQRIDAYFGDATQLAESGAQTLAPESVNRSQGKELVLGIYRSRQNRAVYGLGVFYASGATPGNPPLFVVYDHAYEPIIDRKRVVLSPDYNRILPGGIVEVSYRGRRSAPPDDYTRAAWYKNAVATPDTMTYYGPYWAYGRSFISATKAFRRGGKIGGVFVVDTLTVTFKSILTSALDPGDIGYVESTRDRTWLLGTSRLPRERSNRIERTVPLRYSLAVLHLSADASPLRAANAAIVSGSIVLACAVWVFAGMFGIGLALYGRSRNATIALEREQVRLENEMAIARKVEAGLRKSAYTDALTGLPNRAAFWDRASEALAQTRDATRFAIFFIDLDRFNVVNDTRGHLAGDELLKIIAARLREILPETASLSRLGGDEFVVLVEIEPSGAAAIADRILTALREPMILAGQAVYTGASIGIVLVDPSYERPEDLLRDADIAMYRAKRSGRGRYTIFDTEMRLKVARDSEMDHSLHRAIERREFVPYYQPILDIESRTVVSFEALVRWNKPGRGIVGAVEFIEYAERHGLVAQIDALVLDGVCRDAAVLFEHFPDSTVAVNISAADLTAPGLAAGILAVLHSHHLAVERIKLEITETAAMIDTAQSHKTLDELRRNGIQIILDDFGSGHSSLAYLHQLPIAGVKIDRSFTSVLASDPQAVAIVRTIVALAQTLGYRTVAEGVETGEQLEILSQLGVRYAQGFLFSPAVGIAALLHYSNRSSAM